MVGLAFKRGILSQPLSLAQTIAALGLPVSFSTAGNKQPRSSGNSWGVAAKLPLLVVLLYAELHLRDTTGLQEQLLHLVYGRPVDMGCWGGSDKSDAWIAMKLDEGCGSHCEIGRQHIAMLLFYCACQSALQKAFLQDQR